MLHLRDRPQPGRARARSRNVDVSAAKEAPNVVAVFTGADFADEQGSLPCAWPVTPDMVNPGHPSIAVERGQPRRRGRRGRSSARSKVAAQDAVELVDVDYDAAAGRPRHGGGGQGRRRTSATTTATPTPATTSSSTPARPARAATPTRRSPNAEVVVSRRFVQQRLIPAFMEPRSVVVQPQGDNFTMWSSTQIPHILRVMVALVTGIPEHKLRVIAPDVGGGFGGKLQVNPEEILCLLVARRLGKPVKWTETRSESLMTAHHGRDQIQYIDIAADREGNVKGLKVRLLADMGAYLRLITPGVPVARRVHVPGDLQVPGLPLRVRRRLHQQGAHRRLPRRRPPGGDVRDRADHGRARRRAGHGPARAAPEELDPGARSSRSPRSPA